jgi:hypothetical protein
MEDFERQLKNAMVRREPPPWLEAKVLAAAVSARPEPAPAWWQRLLFARMRWAPALVAVLVLLVGIFWQQDRMARQRAEGEAAKAKLETALRVTSVKLRKIQQIVQAMERDN